MNDDSCTLDRTLRMLLHDLVELVRDAARSDDWINIRGDVYPWRRIVAAAERGECEVSRVGRRLMMQREELAKFMRARRIGHARPSPKKTKAKSKNAPKGKHDDNIDRMLRRDGLL